MFVEQPNKVFTREELLLSSHGKYTESYERTIDFHIKICVKNKCAVNWPLYSNRVRLGV